jgi:hypothetical protein
MALDVANAIVSGNEPIKSAPSECPTGRCTWASYSSLGVCHKCKDVSSLLVPVCQRASLNFPGGGGGGLSPCGYRLRDVPETLITGTYSLLLYPRKAAIGLAVVVVDRTRLLSKQAVFSYNSTMFQNATNTILDFYVAFVPGGEPEVRRNATPVMLECLFQWCVKTFDASHENGHLNERLLSTYLPPDVDSASVRPDYSEPGPFNNPFVMLAGSKSFSVGANLTSGLSNAIMANLPTILTDDETNVAGQYPGRWNFVQNAPYDLDTVLSPIAEAMTNNIRSLTNNSTEQVTGDAWVRVTVVKMQWLWLILPGTLLLGTLILICTTIVKSRRGTVPSWKSSALAILLHGLNEEARKQFGPNASQSEVEAVSQQIWVKVVSDNADVRLVAV